jgi:hypothetical protein
MYNRKDNAIMGKEMPETEIDKLRKQIKAEFNVTIVDYTLFKDTPPRYVFQFPESATDKLDVLFGQDTENVLKRVQIQSESFAKENRWVFPFVTSKVLSSTRKNVYTISFEGVTPLAYAFLLAIMKKIENI